MSINQLFHAKKITGLAIVGSFKGFDVVISSILYINDTNKAHIKDFGGHILTGIMFSKETEKGIFIIDFTSLKDFNSLEIKVSKLIYERGIDEAVDYEISASNLSDLNVFSIIEEETNEFKVIPLRNGREKEGLFRIDVNTKIEKEDHIKVYFSCKPKEN